MASVLIYVGTYFHVTFCFDYFYPSLLIYALDKCIMIKNYLLKAEVEDTEILEDKEYLLTLFLCII